MAATLPRYRFTADDYRAMVRSGILDEDARVELIDGEIVEMSPIGPLHAYRVTMLAKHAENQVGHEALFYVQNPIRLGDRDEPQPDLAIVAPGDYRRQHPTASDVLVLIEVADSSHKYDRETKLRRYAAAGILEAWLVDLGGEMVERHAEPIGERYQHVALGLPGDRLASTVLPQLVIAVDLALGRPDAGAAGR